ERVNPHASEGVPMQRLVHVGRCLALAGVIALGFASAQLVLACGGGGSGVEGEYVMQMGDSPDEAMTLELLSEGKAVLTMPGMPPVQGAHSMEGEKLV